MAPNPRKSNAPRLSADDAKKRVLQYLQEGNTVEAAMDAVGRSKKTYEYWRSTDKDFVAEVDRIRMRRRNAGQRAEVPDFETFRLKYLGRRTYLHQLQWLDVIEGRVPRQLHESMKYEPGAPDMVIVNCPPEHAKSTSVTVDYVLYRIAQDPNVRVIQVSKTQDMAKKFMSEVTFVLERPDLFPEFHLDFAPVDGFKGSSTVWQADKIYLQRDQKLKDPTLQAIGIRQQIYGARADLIVIDDAVILENAHEFEKQIRWIQQEVITRINPAGGVLLVIGTRVANQDLYSELRKPDRYPDNESPWTYFAQPAVLEYGPDPEDWVTLWPRTDVACGCKAVCKLHVDPDAVDHPRWDGPHLNHRRRKVEARTWSMVYQQEDVAVDSVFKPERVNKTIEGRRQPGPLRPGAMGHPERVDGFYRVAGLDPATTGYTAAVVLAVDRATGKRYVLDVFNQAHQTAPQVRQLIQDWTVKYDIHEWRIEDVAFASWVVGDRDITDFLASRGVLLKGHTTGKNKWDPEFGVASMSTLFDADPQLIELPATKQHEPTKALVQQLITWEPKGSPSERKKAKTDIVMALWFAELRAREVLQQIGGATHLDNQFMSPYESRERYVVDLDAAFAAMRDGTFELSYL